MVAHSTSLFKISIQDPCSRSPFNLPSSRSLFKIPIQNHSRSPFNLPSSRSPFKIPVQNHSVFWSVAPFMIPIQLICLLFYYLFVNKIEEEFIFNSSTSLFFIHFFTSLVYFRSHISHNTSSHDILKHLY